jgi:hypothetical protein
MDLDVKFWVNYPPPPSIIPRKRSFFFSLPTSVSHPPPSHLIQAVAASPSRASPSFSSERGANGRPASSPLHRLVPPPLDAPQSCAARSRPTAVLLPPPTPVMPASPSHRLPPRAGRWAAPAGVHGQVALRRSATCTRPGHAAPGWRRGGPPMAAISAGGRHRWRRAREPGARARGRRVMPGDGPRGAPRPE